MYEPPSAKILWLKAMHYCNYITINITLCVCTRLASSPGLLIGGGGGGGGRGKEGLVSTACACAVIIQILNNPITYGYRLYTFMDTFTVKYMENVAHAHAVDTRPSFPSPLLPIRRPGDEASTRGKVIDPSICCHCPFYITRSRDLGIMSSDQCCEDVTNGEKVANLYI